MSKVDVIVFSEFLVDYSIADCIEREISTAFGPNRLRDNNEAERELMAAHHEHLIEQIQALNHRAQVALNQHHPEKAVPLIERALELQQLLNQKLSAKRVVRARDSNGVELLDVYEVEALSEFAYRNDDRSSWKFGSELERRQ